MDQGLEEICSKAGALETVGPNQEVSWRVEGTLREDGEGEGREAEWQAEAPPDGPDENKKAECQVAGGTHCGLASPGHRPRDPRLTKGLGVAKAMGGELGKDPGESEQKGGEQEQATAEDLTDAGGAERGKSIERFRHGQKLQVHRGRYTPLSVRSSMGP